MSADYAELDAHELRISILSGERSCVQTVKDCLARIDALDGELHAFLTVERERALERAARLDRRAASGEHGGPLFGVPVAIKANMCWQGAEASCGSRMLAGWKAPYTATFVQRLLDADAIVVGATNMDEFAMGSSSENSAFGPSRNPWDTTRTPGGSSSGSAVAVAARMVPLALGSDTGGSVRQPAAMCGVMGFKPTYGRVSRYGLVAFGSSLDQVSPFARSARDLAAVMGAIGGHDAMDSTSLDEPALSVPDAGEARGLTGLKLGVPAEYFTDDLEPGVRARVEAGIDALRALGCELVPVSLPHSEHAIATYYVVATAEASSNLARYDGSLYGLRAEGDGSLQGMFAASREAGFGAEVKRRILLGTYVLSSGYYEAWYGRALRARTLLRRDFERAFERCDLIVGPTAPTTAFRLGEKLEDPVAMYLSDALTVPVSLAGLPAVSLPCGLAPAEGTDAGLPVGLQLVAPAREDARVLRVAGAYQARFGDARLVPPLAAREVRA